MNRKPRPDLNRGPAAGGERPGDRKAIERMTERMISSGVPGSVAHREAKQSMVRVDRKLRDEGRR